MSSDIGSLALGAECGDELGAVSAHSDSICGRGAVPQKGLCDGSGRCAVGLLMPAAQTAVMPLWPHFLFKYYEYPMDEEEVVYMYLHGDFGAASMPGTWYIFFSEVVVPMARAVGVRTVPMAVYV